MMPHRWAPTSLTLAMLMSLAACGGGGGGTNSTPAPPPAASIINFDTSEYRRTDGAVFHGAITAWQNGASGQGITVGVIDTGIDIANAEFSARIDRGTSRALGGNSSYQDEDGHGTAVTGILAAARNDSQIMGIAFNSTIMALRADRPGSCTTDDGCTFFDNDITAALDHATVSGARVVNLSLGGNGASNSLLAAVNRATAAGVIIVVAAGNERGETNPAYDPNNPSPFATAIMSAGNGLVIIATSINSSGDISPFSNLAGNAQSAVLSARGENVQSIHLLSEPSPFSFSGTSFSTPQIAGAAALLAQAFPNLSSAQIVQLLMNSARDAGAAGDDNVYGQGILDIAAAFAPQGTTSLAGSSTPVSMTGNGELSAPMGDAASTASLSTVILDSYGRAYGMDLGSSLRMDTPSLLLAPRLQTGERSFAAMAGGARLAVSIAPGRNGNASITPLMLSSEEAGQARAQAGYIATRINAATDLAIGFSYSAGSLAAIVRGSNEPAFLIAPASGSEGFRNAPGASFALRRQLGSLGLTLAGESGDALVRREWSGPSHNPYDRRPYSLVSVGIDRQFGSAALSLTASHMSEDSTVLGARFNPLFGAGSARTLFVDGDLRWMAGNGWTLGAAWRQGWTWAASGGALQDGALLKSSSFAIDAAKQGLFGSGDRIAFRLSQPLRISSGGLALTLPNGYDYRTLQTSYAVQRYNLAPSGREINAEAAYSRPLSFGDLTANLYYRKESGNIASYPDDLGLALRFSADF